VSRGDPGARRDGAGPARASREEIVAIDKRRVWHPYTEMGRYRAEVDPLVVVEAQGSRLRDADGRSYLDGNASWWSSLLGHGHPRLVRALARQSETLCHAALAGIAHEPAALLAEELCRVAPPGLEHVFFGDDGSTAVEIAMKLCLQYWAQNGARERNRLAALEGAFHGETLGATALGGVELFRRPFAPVLAPVVHLPPPREPGAAAEQCFERLTRCFREQGERLAALVLEPVVQGAAGMYFYDPEYLRLARRLCDEYAVFLVFDEVFSGYGRTGPMWAAEHAGVSPDLLCLAKGFTGGMLPMSATLVGTRLFEGFLGSPERAFYYGHTFCGNPLGAAVAREVLRIFEQEKILELARPKAARIAECFAELGRLPGVSRARSLGMIGALDLAGPDGYLAGAGWRVYERARARGAYLRPLGNVVYVTPSLNIPDADLAELLAIVSESVAEVAAGAA